MYMRIYAEDTGQVIAEGDVSTSNSTIAGRTVIDRAVAAGYDVECEGNLYHDPSGKTGHRAHASIMESEEEDARVLA